MDLQAYRAKTACDDERIGAMRYFEAGKNIKGGNGAMVERIETHGNGVLLTLSTSRVRWKMLLWPDGSSARSADEDVTKKAEAKK